MKSGHAVLYPDHYAWYILAGTLDILITYTIIEWFGGWEANGVARHLLERFGWAGMIALKYSTVVVVVAACEIIGRRSRAAGKRLAIASVCISALPVGLGLLQVWAWTHRTG